MKKPISHSKIVTIEIHFHKTWILHFNNYKSRLDDFLKDSFKDDISFMDGKIQSLFGLKRPNYDWQLFDKKRKNILLSNKVPHYIIISCIEEADLNHDFSPLNKYEKKPKSQTRRKFNPIKKIKSIIILKTKNIKKSKTKKSALSGKKVEKTSIINRVKKQTGDNMTTNKAKTKAINKLKQKVFNVHQKVKKIVPINTIKKELKSIKQIPFNIKKKIQIKIKSTTNIDKKIKPIKSIKPKAITKSYEKKIAEAQPAVKKPNHNIEKLTNKKKDLKLTPIPKKVKTKAKSNIKESQQKKSVNKKEINKTSAIMIKHDKKVKKASNEEINKQKVQKDRIAKKPKLENKKKEKPKKIKFKKPIIEQPKSKKQTKKNITTLQNVPKVTTEPTKDSFMDNVTVMNKENKTPENTFRYSIFSIDEGLLYDSTLEIKQDMTVIDFLLQIELPLKMTNGFIESINDIPNSNTHAWMYQVNGSTLMIPANEYIIQPGDIITWKYVDFTKLLEMDNSNIKKEEKKLSLKSNTKNYS